MGSGIIAVDVDDVIASSAKGFVDFSNKTWGTKLTIEDYDERWAKMWSVDHQEGIRRADIIYGSSIFNELEHFEDAELVLRRLSKDYKLIVTTSRAKQSRETTEKWIELKFPNIFSEIHLTGFYDEIKEDSHTHTKANICQELDVEWLIDDHPKHCFAAAEIGVKVVMFGDYSWNRNLKLEEGMFKAKDWDSVDRYFYGPK